MAPEPGTAATPFVALIPARMASTRLPGKALLEIAGRAMVLHVADRARLAGASRVAVATDDERIAQTVRAAGIEAVMTSSQHATGTDRLSEAAELLGLSDDTIVVNVQGDEPQLPAHLIAGLATHLANDAGAAIATAGHRIESIDEFLNPNIVKIVCDRAQRAMYFSRAPIPFERDHLGGFPQQLPVVLGQAPALRHIGLYAYRAGFLRVYPTLERSPLEAIESLEQLRALWHGYQIAVQLIADAPPAGIDTPSDLNRVRASWPHPGGQIDHPGL